MHKGYRRHKFIYNFVRLPVRIFLWFKLRFKLGKVNKLKGPFILISNHVTNFDMLMLALSYKEYMYFVASEHAFRAGFASKILRFAFDPIARPKASVGTGTVLEMKRRLKQGHSICIFAEGIRSANGISGKMMPATAAILKLFGVPVVTYKLHGGYLTSPRWSSGIRKGHMEGEQIHVYSPEEIKKMSAEELDDAINADIFEDAYEWNKERKIRYKTKNPAEGIENELVACPNCHGLNTIKSKGNTFFCDCGMNGTVDDYGKLSGDGFCFETVTEWDAWEKKLIEGLPDYDENTVLASTENQILREIKEEHTSEIISRGTLSITPKALSIGDFTVELDNISLYDIILQGYILFGTSDGRHFEIRNSEAKVPGFLYVRLINRYKKKGKNKND